VKGTIHGVMNELSQKFPEVPAEPLTTAVRNIWFSSDDSKRVALEFKSITLPLLVYVRLLDVLRYENKLHGLFRKRSIPTE
jgi:hypothetical protein